MGRIRTVFIEDFPYAVDYDFSKKNVVDYLKPIYERPNILDKKQYEEFKKEYSEEKIIELTNSVAIQHLNIPKKFGQGNTNKP